MRLIILIFLIIPTTLLAFENPKVKINNFYIQKYEVTIAEFSNFANKTNFKTEAEKQGFGYEYGVGWEKRKNWNYKTPYGKNPESLTEPAVHILTHAPGGTGCAQAHELKAWKPQPPGAAAPTRAAGWPHRPAGAPTRCAALARGPSSAGGCGLLRLACRARPA